MSLNPLVTHIKPSQPLYAAYTVSGGGGGGAVSTFDTASISSLTVSSINGAAPGGSVAPGASLPGLSSIGVSTLTANGVFTTNGLSMSNTTLDFGAPGFGGPIQYFNAGDSNLYISGLSTHTVRIGTTSTANVVQIGDTGIFTANIFGVSTLNGSQPVITTAYPVSTLTGTTTYIPQNNVAWPLSGDIPVTANHSYRISGNLAVGNPGGSGYTTLAVSGGGVGFPAFIHSYPNALANPGNNGLAGGVAGIVKPSNAGPLQIVGYNSDAAQSTTCDFYWTNWVVEDLGTGLF